VRVGGGGAVVRMRTFTCGACEVEFVSNEPDSQAECPECRARPCEFCGEWTGGS